ncbi:MAG TPA: LssY C-terminal domain-containing protein, partial [Burkholderiaceae bacterium]|nr:LssY C-terminal domain-containing protein [Burkholderiaceae bacterium]
VGLSHTTGQITHHIAAEVDQERDKLVADLQKSGSVVVHWIEPFQKDLQGRNGGGDRFITDGRLVVFSEQ